MCLEIGETTTKINFATTPPPLDKVYIPNYSKEMMEELAKKMDTLIQWGVLVRAEDLGITVENVSPSMLIPKGDGDGFRFVTDSEAAQVIHRGLQAVLGPDA